MYQITLASDKRFFDWVDIIAGRIKAEIENSVVIKYKERERVYLGVALKEKGNADKVVFDVLYDFFLKDVKGQYLYSIIKRYAINEFLVQVYIQILKCFNTVEEKDILRQSMKLYSHFSLDGFYKFRLAPLKEKWDELVALTYNNIDLLKDEESFVLLIENLISCLPISTKSAYVEYNDDTFGLKFSNGKNMQCNSEEEVIFSLIENLPERVILSKNIAKKDKCLRIESVFGARFVQIKWKN